MMNDQESCRTGELGAGILAFVAIYITFLIVHIGINILSDNNVRLLFSSVYTLLVPLMSYMFSQALQYNQEGKTQFILIWMILMEFLRTTGDPIFTWGLWKWGEQLLQLLWVGYLVFSSLPLIGIWRITILYFYVAFYVVRERIISNKAKASYLIGKNPKLIHNYVKRIMLRRDLLTTPMNRCAYIVMGEENHEINSCSNGYNLGNQIANSAGLLTIGSVFQHNSPNDNVFTSPNPDWRDTCLSFALAKMLRRRFVKLPLDEAGCRKALDFVLNGLIDGPVGERNQIERVFSIIHEELKFVSDFFHIKAPAFHYNKAYIHYLFSDIIHWFAFLWLFMGMIFHEQQEPYNHCLFHVPKHSSVLVNLDTFYRIDQMITLCLFMGCYYIACYGSMNLRKSNRWINLLHARDYMNNLPRQNRYHSALAELKSSELYPLLVKFIKKLLRKKEESVESVYSSILDLEADTILFYIKVNVSILERLPKWFRRNIPRSPPTVVHSTDAKQAIIDSLKKSVAPLNKRVEKFDQESLLTNGESSLKRYKMENLNWAYLRIGSTTEAILVWHITTTLFHHQELPPEQNNDLNEEPASEENINPLKEHEVALELSSYCHYLVKFLPELLPDDVEWIQDKYETVTKEISDISLFFHKKPTKIDRCNYAMKEEWSEGSVVGKGAKLANDLMKSVEQGKEVWKMMAEFWAEMLLFLAPSDNVEGHEKILDRKELITQLWALLTHAGIVTSTKPTEDQDHQSGAGPNCESEINQNLKDDTIKRSKRSRKKPIWHGDFNFY